MMAGQALLIEVRWLDHRYHGIDGARQWPPSPFRLFQALVAGAYGGRWSVEPRDDKDAAFEWLEALDPPVVSAPVGVPNRTVSYYVPHNDADVSDASAIKAEKFVRPRTLDGDAVLRFFWSFDDGGSHARLLAGLTNRLHTLGRGIDPAYARAAVIGAREAEQALRAAATVLHQPSGPGDADDVRCPAPGSLASLRRRYHAMANRFDSASVGRRATTLFRQPPKAVCAMVRYGRPRTRLLFDLVPADGLAPFRAVPTHRAVELTTVIRDLVAERLRAAFTGQERDIERFVIGRGVEAQESSRRLRFVPIPSLGHEQTRPSIRRVMVDVPHDAPFRAADVEWALAGRVLARLDRVDLESGEGRAQTILVRSDDERMLSHYGVERPARVWRSVTPLALPAIDCAFDDGVGHEKRVMALSMSVVNAIRHAGLDPRNVSIRTQREPFWPRGPKAGDYAGARFSPEVLRHVEVTFPEPLAGPLVLGDGRFLGLGIMAPVPRTSGLHTFAVESGIADAPDPVLVTRALRRAVMARVQDVLGPSRPMSAFFSGHDGDGSPARSARSSHVAFVFDPAQSRLLIVAPHVLDGRDPTPDERRPLATLDRALENFTELRAGSAGRLALRRVSVDLDDDPLTARSHNWESVTPYLVTRHMKSTDATAAVTTDLRAECRRRALPNPVEVRLFDVRGVPGVGLMARARVVFAVAVDGPILLGRNRYFGGGLFGGADLRVDVVR